MATAAHRNAGPAVVLLGIIVALLLLLGVCSDAKGQSRSADAPSLIQVGMDARFQIGCRDKADAEAMARSMMTTGNFRMANKMLEGKIAEGVCAAAPFVSVLKIDEVGERLLPFVDDDGDVLEVRAVRFGPAWTVVIAEYPKQ